MNTYLAIDIGASSGRHIVGWKENGRIRTREVYRFSNGAAMKNGHLCWDAQALFSHVTEGLCEAGRQGYRPVSIGIDTWAVDFALLDEAGELVGDLVAYRDSRTEGCDVLLEKVLPFERHYALSGIAKQPFNTVYQMMAVLQEHPEYRHSVRDFLLMPEYLSYRLTGRRSHEWSNLSTTALCDARTHSWCSEIICAADLPETWFQTPIVSPGTVLGPLNPEIAALAGYETEVVLPATHDTASAYMAVPARDEHAAFLSSGTWSLFGTELQTPVTGAQALASGFTNEGGYAQSTRFLKNIMGMWMLQCIQKETGGQYSFAQMAQMAAASDYPFWVDAADNRFLAPESMLEEVKSALREQGVRQTETLADVLRAVIRGLAVCYRDAVNEMSAVTGKRFSSINIVGGGCQNQVLNQMTADLTGLKVYAGPVEGTALGNLAAQMIARKEFATLADFRNALCESVEITFCQPEGGMKDESV